MQIYDIISENKKLHGWEKAIAQFDALMESKSHLFEADITDEIADMKIFDVRAVPDGTGKNAWEIYDTISGKREGMLQSDWKVAHARVDDLNKGDYVPSFLKDKISSPPKVKADKPSLTNYDLTDTQKRTLNRTSKLKIGNITYSTMEIKSFTNDYNKWMTKTLKALSVDSIKKDGVDIKNTSANVSIKGRNNRWFINMGTEAKPDIQDFGNRFSARAAFRKSRLAPGKGGGRTRPMKSLQDYKGYWREVQEEKTKGNGTKIFAHFEGKWRALTVVKWLGSLAAAIAIGTIALTNARTYMGNLATDVALGLMDEDEYLERKKYIMAFLSQQMIVAFAAAVGTAAFMRKITAIFVGIRALGWAGGPLGAIIGFVVGSAAQFAVVWLLNRESVQKTIINSFMDGIDTAMDDDLLSAVFDYSASVLMLGSKAATNIAIGPASKVVNVTGDLAGKVTNDIELAKKIKDPAKTIGLDPLADRGDQAQAGKTDTSNKRSIDDLSKQADMF